VATGEDEVSSRDQILQRIRAAVASAPQAPAIGRGYLREHAVPDQNSLVDLLADNLTDYRAHVHRTVEAELPGLIARLLADRDAATVLVPDGLPAAWLSEASSPATPEAGQATAADLDRIDSVVTACALAIAETGTVILDTGPGQGRRRSTLIPDHHICVVRVPDQVVASVPQAIGRLDPRRPQTWISGPSATSDIELDRVEGVHGPRRLDVVLVES
jgi:L-lactate dehydrogenase complex protein LldG